MQRTIGTILMSLGFAGILAITTAQNNLGVIYFIVGFILFGIGLDTIIDNKIGAVKKDAETSTRILDNKIEERFAMLAYRVSDLEDGSGEKQKII